MIAKVRKAITGGVAAAAAAFGTANADGIVTDAEWGGVTGALIIGFITVYLVPNASAAEADQRGD